MTNKKADYFLLFSNCVVVRGAKRSTIYDLQFERYKNIPNLLADVLGHSVDLPIKSIKLIYNDEYSAGIDSYLNLLAEERFGTFYHSIVNFIKLPLDWKYPGELTNCVIEVEGKPKFDLRKVFKELDDLNCHSVQFWFLKKVKSVDIESLLEPLSNSRIRNVELVIPYNNYFSRQFIESFSEKHPRVRRIVFTECYKKLVKFDIVQVIIESTKMETIELTRKFNNSPSAFRVSLGMFTESQEHNTFFNKKISIDRNGLIKNFPTMTKSFGHINEISFSDAINNSEFKKFWSLKKDNIVGCKNCEFRFMCSGQFAHPSANISELIECQYDPLQLKWN